MLYQNKAYHFVRIIDKFRYRSSHSLKAIAVFGVVVVGVFGGYGGYLTARKILLSQCITIFRGFRKASCKTQFHVCRLWSNSTLNLDLLCLQQSFSKRACYCLYHLHVYNSLTFVDFIMVFLNRKAGFVYMYQCECANFCSPRYKYLL